MPTDTPKRRITTLVLLFPVLVLLLYGGLMHLYFTYAQNRDTQWEITQYENRLMDTEVGNLKQKVHNLAQFIRHYDSQSATKIKKNVQAIVDAAVDVASGLMPASPAEADANKTRALIVRALKPIGFEEHIGYLFVLDMQGNVYVHRDPKLVGSNILNIQDSNGKYIIHEFNKILRQKGEGFVEYYWYIPGLGNKKMHYKISFVKKIKGTNLYVGAGEYLHYMRRFVQKDMLKYLQSNAKFDGGYFFVTDSVNSTVYHPDGDATRDAQEYLIEGVYRDDECIAYTEYIAQYDWYITAVKSLEQLRANIEQNKAHILRKREKNIQASLWIMLAMLLLSSMLSLYLSSVINRRLRAYEEQLKESNEKLVFQSRQALIGELLPMIAHQWRQPINKIASILALMRFDFGKGACDTAQADQQCQQIEESVEFMSETIDDFRTFYRPRNESEVVDLSQLIVKAAEFVSGSIRQKDIQLSMNLENVEYRLYANEFLQVMINLIKNAADASHEHGKITVELYRKEEVVSIVVSDNGDGVGAAELTKIFDPYFSTKDSSMGLGLYMTKMIVEKHMNGTIDVTNLPESGAQFSIRLY
jgi:signal transduction histidine kinase